MSDGAGHPDRLAGLVVLTAALAPTRSVAVRGIHPSTLTEGVGPAVDLTDDPATADGAVLASRDGAGAVARLAGLRAALPLGRPGLVWVIWGGGGAAAVHRAAERVGLREVASFGTVGCATSPTHLVRVGSGHALRWFATSARPRWGLRSRLAALGNRLPPVGRHFFAGQAVLFRAVGALAPAWPGADATGRTTTPSPAVLHLGGGATAGRLVLTWADDSGAPTRHTKIAPAHLAPAVVVEADALAALPRVPAVADTVPALLELRQEPTWTALTASHLPGRPVRRADTAVAAPRSVDAAVVAWLGELARATAGTPPPRAPRVPTGRLERAVTALGDDALASTVRHGLRLGTAVQGLLHGDLWPGNVHVVTEDRPPRIAVLDWECALVGHPLVDLLTWLVTRAGPGGQVGAGALAALRTRRHVDDLLATIGHPLEGPDVEALVLAQLVVVAVAGGPAGTDPARQRVWLDAVRDVWTSWQRAGSPWSSPWSSPSASPAPAGRGEEAR